MKKLYLNARMPCNNREAIFKGCLLSMLGFFTSCFLLFLYRGGSEDVTVSANNAPMYLQEGSIETIFLGSNNSKLNNLIPLHQYDTYAQFLHDRSQEYSDCPQNRTELNRLLSSFSSKSPDDLDLVTLVRKCLIDPPSRGVPKMSMPLFQTAQAKRTNQILNDKVRCMALIVSTKVV